MRTLTESSVWYTPRDRIDESVEKSGLLQLSVFALKSRLMMLTNLLRGFVARKLRVTFIQVRLRVLQRYRRRRFYYL
jgi:hypothetical protein